MLSVQRASTPSSAILIIIGTEQSTPTCTTAPASGFTHLLPGKLSAAHSPARGSEAGSRAVGSNPQRGLATMAVSDSPMLLAYGMRVAGLPAMDRNGKADPYLKLSVRSCAACTCMRGLRLGRLGTSETGIGAQCLRHWAGHPKGRPVTRAAMKEGCQTMCPHVERRRGETRSGPRRKRPRWRLRGTSSFTSARRAAGGRFSPRTPSGWKCGTMTPSSTSLWAW